MVLEAGNILLIGSSLLLISLIAGKTTSRLGVPTLIFFLIVGILAGSEGLGGIHFANAELAQIERSYAQRYEQVAQSIVPQRPDAALLATSPDRDFRCGFVEAVKVALLEDPALFAELCESAPRIRDREMDVCLSVIRRSAEWHLQHITRGGDPFEALEARPLDFGHWSAHKLEVLTNFELRHGEAVAIGVAIDTIYSSMAAGLSEADARRVMDCLTDLGYELDCPQLQDEGALMAGMEEFRQHLGGRLTLTMLAGIGRPIDVHEVDRDLMHQAIGNVRAYQSARQHKPAVRAN